VVRLTQGEPERQTVYGDDPVEVAERFVSQGARWIHVVDLDRAFGTGDNHATLSRLTARLASKVCLQLGGGLRNWELVRAALSLGVSRVVIGTAAATEPGFVREMVTAVGPQSLAAAIDTRNGWVALRGWTETSAIRARDLARQVVSDGITTLVYTDISRDGMLSGPDLAGAAALREMGAAVIVSGGVASARDIRAACEAGFEGAIVGKALHDGILSLPDALEAAAC
jgi:phosphoribosylformimino-5-aminoimidazole carboxamide ribotide isomerase